MHKERKLFIAKVFSRPITILLILFAVFSIVVSTHVAAKYDVLLVLFTFIIPISTIFLFKQLGITQDYNVTRREDRPKLFFIMALTFFIATLVAYQTGDENLITVYRVLFSTFSIGLLITIFWKIS